MGGGAEKVRISPRKIIPSAEKVWKKCESPHHERVLGGGFFLVRKIGRGGVPYFLCRKIDVL